jgi:hypothetical protein
VGARDGKGSVTALGYTGVKVLVLLIHQTTLGVGDVNNGKKVWFGVYSNFQWETLMSGVQSSRARPHHLQWRLT